MIAWTAILRIQANPGLLEGDGEGYDLPLRPKWSLEALYDEIEKVDYPISIGVAHSPRESKCSYTLACLLILLEVFGPCVKRKNQAHRQLPHRGTSIEAERIDTSHVVKPVSGKVQVKSEVDEPIE